MNYPQLLQYKNKITQLIASQLGEHKTDFCGAVNAARCFISEQNPLDWLTGNMRADMVELIRLYSKPNTFEAVVKASQPHRSGWAVAQESWEPVQGELLQHAMHIMKDATLDQKVQYVFSEIMTGFLERVNTSPRPIQALIKGTLFEAIWEQHMAAFLKHLEQGASVNDVLEPLNDTCLMFAIRYKRTRAIKWVMAKTLNIQRMNSHGETALDLARRHGLDDVAHKLLELGASG